MIEIFILTFACLASGWWLPALLLKKHSDESFFLFWTLSCLTGLLVTYFLIVIQIPIAFLWIFHCFSTLLSIWYAIYKKQVWTAPPRIFGIIFILICASILLYPLRDWDARSIWFFHAKIFHFENLRFTSTLAEPSVGFSHPHYTHFFPMMTAYVLTPWPFWNAYVPKVSLLLLLIPVWLGFLSLSSKLIRWKQTLIGLTLFGLPGPLLWNGYMDGYLAAFFVLGTWALVQFYEDHSMAKGWLAAFFYAISILLKQEGMALVLISICLSGVYYIKYLKNTFIWFTFPCFFAFILYITVRKQIPTDDYFLNSQSPLKFLFERIVDPASLLLLGKYLITHLWGIFIFVIILHFWFRLYRFSWNLFLIIAFVYTAVLSLIYLSTSFEFPWYLATSVSRTLLVVQLLLILSLVLPLNSDLQKLE